MLEIDQNLPSTMALRAPLPLGILKVDVFGLAERVSDEFGLSPGEDLTPLVEALGGKIEEVSLSDFAPESHGSIEVMAQGNFTIYLPRDVGPNRNRFTLGHELGHYFLHAPASKFRLRAERFGNSRVETEANWFSAALLMPEKALRSAFVEENSKISVIASRFGVSETALSIRAAALGIAID